MAAQRLPIPGQDDGLWGQVLNGFLGVSHNADGTLQLNAITGAGGVQLGGDLGGTASSPILAKLQGVPITGTPSNGQVLAYNNGLNQWVPSTVSSTTVNDATGGGKGIIQLAGDLGGGTAGTAASPQVTSTHLTSALPVNQGGTGSTTQNFVDLTASQTIAGTKTFSGKVAAAALQVTGGAGTSGQYLTSDTSGNATWANLSGVVTTGSLVINVKDYGAKGDGSTDDSTAIANAIAAAQPAQIVTTGTAGTVFFPAGTYITNPLPALSEQITLVGVGPATIIQLKANSSGSANLITNYQGTGASSQMVNVHDMILDGNKGNQPGGAYQSGIVMNNPSPTGSYGYQDGRHMFSRLTIQNFTGDGLVLVGRGATMVNSVSSWTNNGFGFNVNEDSYFINCDAGASGLDGFLVQGGSNRFAGCKAWFSGASLVNSRGTNASSQPTVNAPAANAWCGGNFSSQLVFSLANGYGNGWHWVNISSTSKNGNFSGGTYTSCGAQDDARAGFYLDDCGRQTLFGIEVDSSNNNGTSDGTAGGTPVGSYAGVEIAGASNNVVKGMAWNRQANVNQMAAALRIDSASNRNRVELGIYGRLNGNVNNVPAMTSDSVMAGNFVKFAAEGGYNAATFASSYTPDPFIASTVALTLTGNITINNPAQAGANAGTGIYYPPGMTLSFMLTQDTTGSRSVSWGNNFIVPSSWLPAPQANTTTVIRFTYNGTSWVADGGQNGIIGATAFAPTGLATGASAASRYVGATASGAPTSGTFAVGDYIIDQSGKIWVCTSAGSPGAWAAVGITSRAPVFTALTASGQQGQYQKVGTITINVQFDDCTAHYLINGYSGGASAAASALVTWRVKQQAAMGSAPFISVYVDNAEQFSPSNFIAVIEQNTVSTTVVALWMQAPTSSESYSFFELAVNPTANSASVSLAYAASSNTWSAIEAGTQTVGTPGPSYGQPMGITGATAPTRYVGGTSSGAPTSGTFAVGDFVIDQTGKVWICTSAGTPGTWTSSAILTAPVTLATGADTNKGLIIKANSATQSADLQEWQDSSGNTIAAFTGSGVLAMTATSSGSALFRGSVNTDANARIQLLATGSLQFGDGTNSRDTTLSRPAAGVLNVANAVSVTGLTGATAASRYVGATASGAPTSGTFAVGDFVIDQTGKVWICTSAGTPGTWTQAGGSSGATLSANTFTGNQTAPAFVSSGLGTNVNAASRYIGATTSGAPTGATTAFSVGDFVIDQTGAIWICTVAGSPGTWSNAAGAASNNPSSITAVRTGQAESGAYLVTVSGGSTASSSGPWTLGLIYFAPVDVAATQTFTGIATDVNVLATGGTTPLIHLGLYADNGTGTKPAASAVMANTEVTLDPTTTTGDRYVAWGSPQTLSPGRYWLAWMITSGSALSGQPTIVTLSPFINTLDTLTNVSHRGWQFSASGTASTFPTLTSGGIFRSGGSWPIIGLKAQ